MQPKVPGSPNVYGTAFLTAAIIVQRYIEIDSRLKRVMAVVTVRESAHSNGLHLFEIDDEGIKIGETLADHEGLLAGKPARRRELIGAAIGADDG